MTQNKEEAMRERIIELLRCVHGEFCAINFERCDCGREAKALRDGTWGMCPDCGWYEFVDGDCPKCGWCTHS